MACPFSQAVVNARSTPSPRHSMSEVSLQEFAREYHEEVASRTGADGGPASPEAAFTEVVLRDLGEEGIIPDGEPYDRRYQDKDLAADGHAFDGEHHLDLF